MQKSRSAMLSLLVAIVAACSVACGGLEGSEGGESDEGGEEASEGGISSGGGTATSGGGTVSHNGAPASHTVNQDGTWHKPGLRSPSANCTACHGDQLQGGDGPGCTECHGRIW